MLPMAAPDPIFDTTLIRRRLARAALQPATFLLDRTVEDLTDRLLSVKRRFECIADIGTPGLSLANGLAAAFPKARIWHLGSSAAGRHSVVGDAEHLPFKAGSLDLAISGLALQGVNDLPGTLVQIRRALKPDGLFLGALIGGRSLNELRTVLTGAEISVMGGVSPRVSPFADVRDMGGLLQRAGFALPVADSEVLTVRYRDLFALMTDLRAMGATNSLVARVRSPSPRALFAKAAALYASRFADPDGRIRATFEIVALSGWAPHESQQPPAKRGSATISLAAVLGERR